MKNIFQINKRLFSVVVLLGIIISVSSCKNDLMDVTYTPENNNITFSLSSQNFKLPASESEFVINIGRGVAKESVSIPLSLSDESGSFSLITENAEFSVGEFTTEVKIKYASSNMSPGVSYPIIISFNEEDKSITGYNETTVNSMLVLEYEEYGVITVVPSEENLLPLMPEGNYDQKIYKAKGTTNVYKIENYYGGGVDVEIGINDGYVSFYSPAPSFYNGSSDVAGYPLIMIPTAMVHPSYGPITAWIDTDPEYVIASNLGTADMLIEGSKIVASAFYTVSAGSFGWLEDEMIVSSIK